MAPRVLVAIPAWNESKTIADVVSEVTDQQVADLILVVDDGSQDATADSARAAGAHVVVLPFNVGVGGAMRTAFLYAQRNGFDRVVQIDADGQHDARFLAEIVSALDDASVVVGARFAGGGLYRVRGPRRWAMKLLSWTLSRIAGTRLTDTTSGFRGADKAAIDLYARHYPAEYLGDTVESLVIASRAGLSVTQVPVEMRERQGGLPSQGPVLQGLYLGRAMLALLSAISRRRPTGRWDS